MYSKTIFSKEELSDRLQHRISSIDMNKVLSAYEMADNAYNDYKLSDGSLFFFHTTRVSKILIDELGIIDPELLIVALLHDIYKTNSELSSEILAFNFGDYVAFLIDILQEDFTNIETRQFEIEKYDNKNIEDLYQDYLIIWLSEHLDNIRCLEININLNPLNYLNKLSEILCIAENRSNKMILHLIKEIKKERNKFYC